MTFFEITKYIWLQLPQDTRNDLKVMFGGSTLTGSILILNTHLDILTDWAKFITIIIAMFSGIITLIVGVLNLIKVNKELKNKKDGG